MKATLEIIPLPTDIKVGGWRRSCRVAGSEPEINRVLWWEYPASVPKPDPNDCDAYLLATLLPAMRRGAGICVRGSVSSELLANLTEFQKVWIKWCPEIYQEVPITADAVRHVEEIGANTVVAFSGGADAQFSAYRHATGLAGNAARSLSAGVFVHGFDIPIADSSGFSAAVDRARSALQDLELDLITVRTNIGEFRVVDWQHYFATALASALCGLKRMAGVGLIASSEPYDALVIPWGSHPMTDPLLSSGNFRIIHDGAGFSRSEKIEAISRWKVGVRSLRVCHQSDLRDRNCGKCEKCVRTRLNFLLAGVFDPACFSSPLKRGLLKPIVLRSSAVRAEWELIRDEMIRTGIGADLLPDVDKVIRRSATRLGWLLPSGSRRRALAKRIVGKG